MTLSRKSGLAFLERGLQQHGAIGWSALVPLAALVGCLAITFWLYGLNKNEVGRSLRDEFEFRADEVHANVQHRLASYEQVIRGAVGLFAASEHVNREEFRAYVEQLHLRSVFPGIQGVGFAQVVSAAEKARHVAGVRAEGFADYSIRPDGVRDAYSSILYLEPFADRNLRAFGYDMYSEPMPRAAMERARDIDEISVSSRVHLVQESDVGVQSGFLMFAPVYRNGAAHANVIERRRVIAGWIYAPFRMHDLMQGILGAWFRDQGTSLKLRIYDGASFAPDSLMFDSALPDRQERRTQGAFLTTRSLEIGGHLWTLEIVSLSPFDARVNTERSRAILAVGLLVSCLLAWVAWLLINSRLRAVHLARRMNRQFIESESRFRSLGDAAPVMIRTRDAAHGVLWLNHSWRQFIDEHSDEVSETAFRERIHPADIAAYRGCEERCFLGRQSYTVEYRQRRHDGSYRWLLETGLPRFDSDGDFLGYVTSAVDITGQKEHAALLSRKGEDLEAIFLSVPDGVVLIDERGAILKINPSFSSLTGYSETMLQGRPVDILLPDRYRSGHQAALLDYMQAPRMRAMAAGRELYAKRVDGSEFPVDISLSPVVLNGQCCVIATLRDVTERVLAKQTLSAALEAAEAASRTKSEFLANMSHEVRTPLNAILGMAELTMSTEIDPIQRQYLEMLRSSAHGLLAIVNDILDFSKIEAGQFRMEAISYDLCASVCHVAKSISSQAWEKGINVAVEIAPDVPETIIGDPARLRQVLWNLLGNAIKFTRSGEVILSVGSDFAAEGKVRLQISVADTGIGIPADMQEAIFQKFIQADSSTTREFGGTGLGLAICRHIVEMMGGRIWVDSVVGEGSTFHFTILAETGDQRRPRREAPMLAGKRVLVADAYPSNRRILTQLLTAHGMQAATVASGNEALDWLQANSTDAALPCDVVVLDARLPDRNGFMLAAHLAEHAVWQNIPVLIMSSGEVDHEAADIVAQLIKPVCRDDLLDALALCVGGAGVSQAGEADGATGGLRLSILVAEDNEVNRLLTMTALQNRGHTVIAVVNGQQAADAAAEQVFDLILMDVQMPVMDGLQATKLIRQREAGSGVRTRILALTANALLEERESCVAADMDGHLAKPIAAADLICAVERNALPRRAEVQSASPREAGDLSYLLRQAGGDASLAQALVEACREDMPGRMAALDQAFGGDEREALRRAAHVMKGMIAVFGEGELFDRLGEVEEQAMSKGVGATQVLRPKLVEAIEDFLPALDRLDATLKKRLAGGAQGEE